MYILHIWGRERQRQLTGKQLPPQKTPENFKKAINLVNTP